MDKRFKGKKRVKPVKKDPKGSNAGSTGRKLKKKTALLSSEPMVTSSAKPVNQNIYNRADDTLNRLMGNTGIPRQKVRMK